MSITFELKQLHHEAVPAALERAERYRLLNEPSEAESICRDILAVEPEHDAARRMLILALTDQLDRWQSIDMSVLRQEAQKLANEYEQQYYLGIISERRGKARLKQDYPGCGFDAYECLRSAMTHYEAAEKLAPPGNDEALLRWNTCARKIMRDARLAPRVETDEPMMLE